MVLIDIFTRYSTVIPIKSKQPPNILAGVMEGMQKMKGTPEIVYSDEESSLYNKTVEDYFKEERLTRNGVMPRLESRSNSVKTIVQVALVRNGCHL